MGGGPYYITMPKMVRVNLTGKLAPWVSAKDVILEVLRIMSVKGGVGKIVEYGGEGVRSLNVPERATITNMGAELGATTSILSLIHISVRPLVPLQKKPPGDTPSGFLHCLICGIRSVVGTVHALSLIHI